VGPRECVMVFASPAAAAAAWLAATPAQRLGFLLFVLGAACVGLSLLLHLARARGGLKVPRPRGTRPR
jgi:hypothetical protein